MTEYSAPLRADAARHDQAGVDADVQPKINVVLAVEAGERIDHRQGLRAAPAPHDFHWRPRAEQRQQRVNDELSIVPP